MSSKVELARLPQSTARHPRAREASCGGVAVAHVGHTGTDQDRDRWLATGIWLDRVDRTFFHRIRASEDSGSLHCDVIDLNGCPRRDFLCERDRYDIVIMHYLWSPPP